MLKHPFDETTELPHTLARMCPATEPSMDEEYARGAQEAADVVLLSLCWAFVTFMVCCFICGIAAGLLPLATHGPSPGAAASVSAGRPPN
jgi:hypothetical protein